jgi:hypothetical protein
MNTPADNNKTPDVAGKAQAAPVAESPQPISFPKLEVFRVGDHTTSQGDRLFFSADDLSQMVAAYDPINAPAPIVVGHPKSDAPAYGWAGGFEMRGDKLIASPTDVDAEFAALVKRKRYNKISLALFPPRHPSNPKPDGWYPRHIGFLGGAAPAITGLKPVTFNGDDEGVVEFVSNYHMGNVATIFRRLRDWLLADYGQDVADNVIPDHEINDLLILAHRPEPEPPQKTDILETSFTATEENNTMSEQDKARLTALETENQQLRDAAREHALAARRTEFTAQIKTLTDEGKLPAALSANIIEFAMALPDDATVEFSAADGAKTNISGVEAFKKILNALPVAIPQGEAAPVKPVAPLAEFTAPRGELIDAERAALHSKALAYQREHKCDFETAARAVGA